MITEAAQEALETLWIETVEGRRNSLSPQALGGEDVVAELFRGRFVERIGEGVRFTALGKEEARGVIRRHRLAERLLHDVLDVKGEDMEASACKFEHVLSEGVEESICTLLGHPKECPHAKPIPPGPCCKEGKEITPSVIAPLTKMRKRESGHIVYILTENHPKLQKLLAMGVLPGQRIEIIQTRPSYVFQIGQTQVAVDGEIAGNIFVRLEQARKI